MTYIVMKYKSYRIKRLKIKLKYARKPFVQGKLIFNKKN